jgi:hypothetical protein
MKKEMRFAFSALAYALLGAFVLALPAASNSPRQNPPTEKATPQPEAISGKIASVSTGSFTLTIGSSGLYYDEPRERVSAPETVAFSIDKDTTVEGELKVGSQADVTYREDSGKNVAISVRVASQ